MRTFEVALEIPDPYVSLIGSIVVHWSYQERLLADLTYALLNVGPKHGRVAVRSPRAADQIAMIKQLMSLEKVECASIDLDKLAERLRALENMRDLIAHSLWFVEPSTKLPAVQNLSGNWKPDPKSPKVARRITPQAVIFDEKGLRSLINAMKKSIQETHKAHEEIVQKLLALRENSL